MGRHAGKRVSIVYPDTATKANAFVDGMICILAGG